MRKILTILVFCASLFASDAYVVSKTPLLDKVNGKEIAIVHVGAKLNVIKENGKFAEVSYSGYVPQDSTNAYSKLGILELDVEAKDPKILKTIKKTMDEYDNEWLQVSITGFVAKDALTNDGAQVLAKGETLFKERCGSCHALHGYDEFSVNVWPSVIETMVGNAGLVGDETEQLVRFLQSKAPLE